MRRKPVNNLEQNISRIVEELTHEVLLAIRSTRLDEILELDQAPRAIHDLPGSKDEPVTKRRRGRPRKNPISQPKESTPAPAETTEPSPKTDWFSTDRPPAPPLPRVGPSFAERRKQEEAERLKKLLLECILQNPGADAKQVAEKVRSPLGEVQKALDDLVFLGALTMTSGHHGRCYHRATTDSTE